MQEERGKFLLLVKILGIDDLHICFKHVRKNGQVGDGKEVLLPFSYIENWHSQILSVAKKKKKKIELVKVEDNSFSQEFQRIEILKRDFYDEFPDKEIAKNKLSEIIEENNLSSGGLLKNWEVLEQRAILKWGEGIKESEAV